MENPFIRCTKRYSYDKIQKENVMRIFINTIIYNRIFDE